MPGRTPIAIGLVNNRGASPTIIAAFLASTDTTGGVERPGGQGGAYSGGLGNWNNITLTYWVRS